MGPTEAMATMPKESSWASRSPRMEARPTPSARMNGTVMGPVVTPPESNATARKSRGANSDRANTPMYSTVSSRFNGMRKRVRSSATVSSRPTPTATVQMSTGLGMAGT